MTAKALNTDYASAERAFERSMVQSLITMSFRKLKEVGGQAMEIICIH
jgi:hypothetical protein